VYRFLHVWVLFAGGTPALQFLPAERRRSISGCKDTKKTFFCSQVFTFFVSLQAK
jgi:hypothetical protein